MKARSRIRNMLALATAGTLLLLSVLACAVTDQPQVQTAVAEAQETALSAAKNLALTEAAKLVETAKVVAQTQAAQMIVTAQAGGSTAVYGALETLMAGSLGLGSGGYPMFKAPISGEGLTTSTGSDRQSGPDLYALDYFVPSVGLPVYPTLAGIIVYSGCEDPEYGCAVVLMHQNSAWTSLYYSVYSHLQAGSMLPQDTLVDGSLPIGLLGQTGSGGAGAGIHLHFAVRSSTQVVQGLAALRGDNQSAFDFQPYMP